MQTDEKQIFRFNWQVGVVIGVTMVMLIIPLAGVVVLANYLMHPKKELTMNGADSPLRKSLEDVANKDLGSKTSLGGEGTSIVLETAQIIEESARVQGLAKACGGYALPSDDGARLTVQIPGNQVVEFRKACLDRAASLPTKAPDDTRVLVEVVIKTKSS